MGHDGDSEELLVFDFDDATTLIANRTGYAKKLIEQVLEMRSLHAEAHANGENLPENYHGWADEAQFVIDGTRLKPKQVLDILIGETVYMVRLGIMEKGADKAHREWAADWLR
ncbi:MAG: hypothetical protein HN348_05855 [Proteobacteria bacterium]|jgi:hypothetical protein|nr:hypothetical protein [Pseudomonadota bacterium]